jgi:glutamate 5-kinase
MLNKTRKELGKSRRWVVKIGSAIVTDEGRGLDARAISAWAEQIAALHRQGKQLLLVSSGAVAEGMRRLGWSERPKALYELQAAAAVGQMGLVQAYESQFDHHGIRTAQVLLTHEDAADRKRYLNARSTLGALLNLRVIPVINENDTVAFEEIRLGDNDTLGALAANLIEADLYVILTDQQGLYDRDPRHYPEARLLGEVSAGDPKLEAMASGSAGNLGRGGMLTKVQAAAKAARSGASTLVVSGWEPDVLERIARGEEIGTLFRPSQSPIAARKTWLAARLKVSGRLRLDAGAAHVLKTSGRSLLPVGVTAVEGVFSRGDLVACLGPDGAEVARGLVNYNAADARRIIGKYTTEIEAVLGYIDAQELIHRDNLVVDDGWRLS